MEDYVKRSLDEFIKVYDEKSIDDYIIKLIDSLNNYSKLLLKIANWIVVVIILYLFTNSFSLKGSFLEYFNVTDKDLIPEFIPLIYSGLLLYYLLVFQSRRKKLEVIHYLSLRSGRKEGSVRTKYIVFREFFDFTLQSTIEDINDHSKLLTIFFQIIVILVACISLALQIFMTIQLWMLFHNKISGIIMFILNLFFILYNYLVILSLKKYNLLDEEQIIKMFKS
jgi:hypothetical protein